MFGRCLASIKWSVKMKIFIWTNVTYLYNCSKKWGSLGIYPQILLGWQIVLGPDWKYILVAGFRSLPRGSIWKWPCIFGKYDQIRASSRMLRDKCHITARVDFLVFRIREVCSYLIAIPNVCPLFIIGSNYFSWCSPLGSPARICLVVPFRVFTSTQPGCIDSGLTRHNYSMNISIIEPSIATC